MRPSFSDTAYESILMINLRYLFINLVGKSRSSVVVEDWDPSIGKHALIRVFVVTESRATQLDRGVSNPTSAVA